MNNKKVVPIRGYLLHLTHYDPHWYRRKLREKPPDLRLSLTIIDAIATVGFNLLVLDCADAVVYKSHPELKRRYSISKSALRRMVTHANSYGIDVVPKLNFSKTRYHKHNNWLRPYNRLPDNDKYFSVSFELIDELIETCKPKHYFHIGMDEDHDRSHQEYISTILRLRQGLKKRGLRTLIWNDSSHRGIAKVHASKSLTAEKRIPKDIIQVIWDYKKIPRKDILRLIDEGFQVWGAPAQDPLQAFCWKQVILQSGGKGLLMTAWIPTQASNRRRLLNLIATIGPIYSSPFLKNC